MIVIDLLDDVRIGWIGRHHHIRLHLVKNMTQRIAEF